MGFEILTTRRASRLRSAQAPFSVSHWFRHGAKKTTLYDGTVETSASPPESQTRISGGDGIFATTRWSVVLSAGDNSEPGRAALETLCQVYWFPVYALVRARGFEVEAARDFTQEFFSRMLSRDGLSKARRERGRFRSFLAQSVKNFLADEWDKAQAQKRGGGQVLLSIEAEAAEGRYLEGVDGVTPEQMFDRAWAEQLLAEARRRLEREFTQTGRMEVLRILDQLGDPKAPTLVAESARLGWPVNTLKSHLHRARRRHGALLRELIAETVATPVEVEAELRNLVEALSS